MNCLGKITLFVEERKNFKFFRGTISSKVGDKEAPEYVNYSIDIRFTKKGMSQEAQNKLDPTKCYPMDVKSGWLGVETYKNKEGKDVRKLILVVDECSCLGVKDINKQEIKEAISKTSDNLPF